MLMANSRGKAKSSTERCQVINMNATLKATSKMGPQFMEHVSMLRAGYTWVNSMELRRSEKDGTTGTLDQLSLQKVSRIATGAKAEEQV